MTGNDLYGFMKKKKISQDFNNIIFFLLFADSRTTDGLLLPDPLVTMSAYDLSTTNRSPPESNGKFRHSSVDLYNPVLSLPLSEDFV